MHISQRLNYYWAALWLSLASIALIVALPSFTEIWGLVLAFGETNFLRLEEVAPAVAKALIDLGYYGNFFISAIFLPIFFAAVISMAVQVFHVFNETISMFIGAVVIGAWLFLTGVVLSVSLYLWDYYRL